MNARKNKSNTAIFMDKRLKRFVRASEIYKNGVCCIDFNDINETFWFNSEAELQEFVNEQCSERFYDKSLRKGYFDYINDHSETSRYYIEEMFRGKIIKFKQIII